MPVRPFHADLPLLDAAPLRMRSVRVGAAHVVRLTGELDLTTTDRVEQELRRVERTDAHAIEVDLRGLTFIDSMGVRLLLQAAGRSSRGTNRLVITRPCESVQRIFNLCDPGERLPFVNQ